jgi:hypothetical protein
VPVAAGRAPCSPITVTSTTHRHLSRGVPVFHNPDIQLILIRQQQDHLRRQAGASRQWREAKRLRHRQRIR